MNNRNKGKIENGYDWFMYDTLAKENGELRAEISMLIELLDMHGIEIPVKVRHRIKTENELPFD